MIDNDRRNIGTDSRKKILYSLSANIAEDVFKINGAFNTNVTYPQVNITN
jgi:hypothetical protein